MDDILSKWTDRQPNRQIAQRLEILKLYPTYHSSVHLSISLSSFSKHSILVVVYKLYK